MTKVTADGWTLQETLDRRNWPGSLRLIEVTVVRTYGVGIMHEELLSRQQLFELVWSVPMSRLAPRYGMSDVGLKKLCGRHGIPTPGLGIGRRCGPGSGCANHA